MKQNFDYVTMDDYASDMREQSELAAAVISNLRREIRDTKAFFVAAVMAAGGRISIPRGYLLDIDHFELTAWEDRENNCRVFTARRREFASGKEASNAR